MATNGTQGWPERLWRKLVANSNTTFDHLRVIDFTHEVARGNIAGAYPFGAYGERVAAGAETQRVVWPNGVFQLLPTVGAQISIVSTSANDTDGGTGINTIDIHYLDANLAERVERVTLAGLTPVNTTATDIRFIQCMHGVTFGSGKKGAGDITADYSGATYSKIATGEVRCSSSARMVPAGKRAFIAGASASASSGSSAARVGVRVCTSENYGESYTDPLILFPQGSVAVQDNSIAYTFPVPMPVTAGNVIAMVATTDKAATISADWFGWYENA